MSIGAAGTIGCPAYAAAGEVAHAVRGEAPLVSRDVLKQPETLMWIRTCTLCVMFTATPALAAGASQPPAAAIFQAIGKADAPAVRRILEADPSQATARDARGTRALTLALFANSGDGFTAPNQNEIVASLLAHAPDMDFFEACALGTTDRVESMLQADPKLVTTWHAFGWTPLHFAAFGGNVPVADLLIRRGAGVNERARNRFRNEPLAAALLTGQLEAAKRLIEAGADVNARQAGGFAPLHEAALSGRRELIDMLLEKGAEIGARANDGRNAVSEAERGRHAEVAAYLRSRTAPIRASPQISAPSR